MIGRWWILQNMRYKLVAEVYVAAVTELMDRPSKIDHLWLS